MGYAAFLFVVVVGVVVVSFVGGGPNMGYAAFLFVVDVVVVFVVSLLEED